MKNTITAAFTVFVVNFPVLALAEDSKLLKKMHPADRSLFLIIKDQINSNNFKINTLGKFCGPCVALTKGENFGYEQSLQDIRDRYE